MVGEVVQELPDRHQYGVQKLLNLGVANFGVGEYLTDKVHRSLNLQRASWLLPFDDEGGAHNVVVYHDVEEEEFSLFGSDEDWGRCQCCFEAFQGLLCLLSPNEHICLFEKFVERHPSLA